MKNTPRFPSVRQMIVESALCALNEEDFPYGVDTSSWLPNPTDDESSAMSVLRTREFPSKKDYIKWYKQDKKVRPSSGGQQGGVGGWMTRMRNLEIDKEAPEKYELAKSGWNKRNDIRTKLFDTPITINGATYQTRSELLSSIRDCASDFEDEFDSGVVDKEKMAGLYREWEKWKDFMLDVARRAPANCELTVPLPEELRGFQSLRRFSA